MIVSARPRYGDDFKPSAAQLKQRQRFSRANEYSRSVLADPCHRMAYEALAKSLNRRMDRMVASDYLTPPEVRHIELSGYHGQPGDVIRVVAVDDVEVVSVHVELRTAADTILEQGAATPRHGVWNYSATIAPPPGEKLTITATAADRPGNKATASVAYP